MNRDQITAWAREATDEPCPYDNGSVTWSFTKPELERFAALVAAAEREKLKEPIRIRIMSAALDCADEGDTESYNTVKVMCSDVLEMLNEP